MQKTTNLKRVLVAPMRYFGNSGNIKDTLPKFNIEPENNAFQSESPFPGADF